MKRPTLLTSRLIRAGLCLAFALAANRSGLAVNYYLWDNNGLSNPSGGIWDTTTPNWVVKTVLTDSTGTATPVPYVPGAGNLPVFNAVAGTFTYSITNNTTDLVVDGIYNNGLVGFSGYVTFVGTGNFKLESGFHTYYVTTTGPRSSTFNIPTSGPGGLQTGGAGNLYLHSPNSFTGGFNLASAALVYFNDPGVFGTGTINFTTGGTGGAFIAETLPMNVTNSFVVSVNNSGWNFACGTAASTVAYSGNWNLNANTVNIGCGNDVGRVNIFSGIISGTGGIGRQSSTTHGTLVLSGANTYSGKTSIQSGVTSVASVNSVTTPAQQLSSNLGVPSSAANGTIAIGGTTFTGTLKYGGPGETTDRVIDLAGTTGGAILQSDATLNPLTFTSPFTATGAGSKTLTLQGASTFLNTISGAIVDNAPANKTTVVKAQAGTWRLSGVNTYTGGTVVNAGTLEIAGSIAGNVTNSAGVLQLDSASALSGAGSAIVALSGSLANGSVILNFSGNQNLDALYIGGATQAAGTWGSPTSGADHTSAVFTGTGKLNVLGAPVVTVQPQSISVWPDGTATFTVTALNSPTYTWKHNGVNVGVNSSSLTINPAEAADAGTYKCWMTNAFGWTNTTDAVLTIRSTNAYTQIIRGDSPISYWRLNETGGTVAYDYVGGNNGTYNNVILNKTPGYSTIDADACVNLQKMPLGQGSFVSVANYQAFDFFSNPSPQFTLEAWAYFTNIAGVQRIFSTDRATAPGGYMFGISGANQLVFTTSAYQDYYMPPTGSLPSPLQANVWYQLVVGCDGSTLHYYVNGQPVGTAVLATSHGGTNGAPMCLGANGDFLTGSGGTTDNSEQMKGFLDECAIYGTFLGDGQVLAHYNATLPNAPAAQKPVADQPTNYVSLTTTFTMNAVGQDLHYQWTKVGSGVVGSDSSTLVLGPLSLGDAGSYRCLVSNGGGNTNPPFATLTVLPIPTTPEQVGLSNSLVLHLPLDTDYKDISGHKNNGTNVNSTTLLADTPKIGAGYLQYSSAVGGPYNYVTLGKPSDLVFGPAGNFSVAFWVRQDNRYPNLPFFGNATNSTGAHFGFAMAPGLATDLSPTGAWAWSFFDGTFQDYATGDQDSIADNNWHHLAFVFDRASSATVYLDGRFVSSVNDSYLGGVDSGQVFNIGQDPTGAYDVAAQADLDDLGVWKRALTQLEVSGMYLAGANNTPGVSFAPVLATVPTATTVGSLSAGATTLSYSGGGGSQFVLLGTNNVAAPLANWTRIHTNLTTPGSFTIPAVGSGSGPMFYRVKSE